MTQAQNVAELSSDINSSGVLLPAGGGTGISTTPTQGGIVYGTASTQAYSAAGTSGYFLQSNGASAPSWAAVPTVIPSGTVILFYQSAAPTGWTQVTTAALNDSAIRVVTSTGGSTGGSVGFTTAFASQTPAGTVSVGVSAGTLAAGNGTLAVGVGTLAVAAGTLATASTTATGSVSLSVGGSVSSYTLTTSDIPSHTHTASVTDSGHKHNDGFCGQYGGGLYGAVAAGTSNINTQSGQAANQPYSSTNTTGISVSNSATGGGGGHSHGFTNPSYSFTGTGHTHTITGSPSLSGSPALSGSVSLSGSPSITSSTFSGTAINLAVKYANIIICSKD
jgi:hypothetical protein